MKPLLYAAVLSGCGALAMSAQAQSGPSWAEIAIAQVKASESPTAFETGYNFYNSIKGQSASIYSERDVAEIAELLNDDNGDVRFWTAVSLGYIGPRAVGASSALQDALQRAVCRERPQRSGPRESFAIKAAMLKKDWPTATADCPMLTEQSRDPGRGCTGQT